MTVLAQVGVGGWGRNLLRNFSGLDGVEVRYAVELSEPRRMEIARSYPRTQAVDQYERVLEDAGVEAVVIATTAETHHALAKAALLANKHVYVEKPMTLSVAHARELIALAAERRRVLMVGHLLEYHPAVIRLKKMIDDGDLGDVYYIYSQRLNLGQIRQDEDAIWSLAPHDISVICYLLNATPETVCSRGGAYVRPDVADVGFVTLTFPNGKVGNIHVSWLDPHKVRRFTVVGSKKMAVFDDMESLDKIRLYDRGVDPAGATPAFAPTVSLRFGDIWIPRIDLTEPLSIECKHFIECVRTGKQPRSDGADGLRVVQVLDASHRSLAQGGAPVRIS